MLPSAAGLIGCVPNREEAHAEHFLPAAAATDLRGLQSRRFDTKDEGMLLQAVAGVFQDLGFQIDESRPQVGLIAGSKDRSAIEAGQVAAQILLALLAGAAGTQYRGLWTGTSGSESPWCFAQFRIARPWSPV
jgi:hypothetical protein